jgi:TPR repeat protein
MVKFHILFLLNTWNLNASSYTVNILSHNSGKDYKQAVAWYIKAANQGIAGAQHNLGVMYDNGQGITKDSKQAVVWFTKAANQGVVKAQCNLGFKYFDGLDVTKDDKQAVVWFTKAANQGVAEAQFRLGILDRFSQ